MTATATEKKLKVFSGIQPTGKKTLGNYSGGFRQYVQTQAVGDAFFCIVDLHSITVEHDPEELRTSTLDLAAMLFAAGLDADKSTVFCQSHVTAHAEAAWLLAAVTSYGQLGRMTQFKDKSESSDFISAGLFTYPILMAGDILLYQTDLVPIGDDQRQHLELARDVAERFNYRFGETFRVPGGQFPEIGGRIMDLQEPTKKMSTTFSSEQGAVYIADTSDQIRKKFKSAVTDSEREIRYDPQTKPGVSNLLEIMSVATGDTIDDLVARFQGAGYGDLKEAVGESVVELLAPIQERFAALRADERELQRLLAVGADKARRAAEPTLDLIYERMGFVRAEGGRYFGAARPRGL
ncbi:MAG TPA: tryptophan--tRNA ligase [Gaiellaceae bacterium]